MVKCLWWQVPVHEEAVSGPFQPQPFPASSQTPMGPGRHCRGRVAAIWAGEITETWGGDSVGDTARDLVLEGGISEGLWPVGNLSCGSNIPEGVWPGEDPPEEPQPWATHTRAEKYKWEDNRSIEKLSRNSRKALLQTSPQLSGCSSPYPRDLERLTWDARKTQWHWDSGGVGKVMLILNMRERDERCLLNCLHCCFLV